MYHVNHVDDQDDYVNIQEIFDDQSIIQKIKYKEDGCDVGRYYLKQYELQLSCCFFFFF